MKLLVYLVGPPGAGKTTTMRNLTVGYERIPAETGGCPLIHLHRDSLGGLGPLAVADDERDRTWRIIEVSRDRDDFAGTDALSMSIQPKAVEAMQALAADPGDTIVLAEGDRLANDRFLQACEEAGWEVRVVYMATGLQECAERRAKRGSAQDETWVRGRITKSRTLASRWGGTPLDGHRRPAQVAADLAEMIAGWMALQENPPTD